MIPFLQTELPPSNLSYLVAAFLVTGVVFLGYTLYIFRRRHETRAEIQRLRAASDKREGQDGDEA